MIFSTCTLAVFADGVGDRVSYTSRTVGDASIFKANGAIGCCAQPGKPHGNGTGTISRVIDANSTGDDALARKVIYWTSIVKGWTDNPNSGGSTTNGATYSIFAQDMVQMALGYSPDDIWTSGVSQDMIDKVTNAVNSCKNQNVPAWFKVYFVKTSSDQQNFVYWYDAAQTGIVRIKKVSGNTGITG